MITRDPSLGTDAPARVTAGLAAFARNHPSVAQDLLGAPDVKAAQFGPRFVGALDELLLGEPQPRDIGAMASAFGRLMCSPHWTGFLRYILRDARMASASRVRRSALRSVWGTTPIISLTSCRASERLLGVKAETLVFQTYYITSSFDIILQPLERWFSERDPANYQAFRWLVFLWALLRYDSFYYFNDAGILPAGGYGKGSMGINEDEMRLIRDAGKALYTLAYGADYRTRMKTLGSGTWNFCMDCPEVGRYCLCDGEVGERIFATIDRYATAVLGTGLSLAYLPRPRNIDYLVIDTRIYEPAYTEVPLRRALRIAHVPNHPHFKGTRFLVDAVERLRAEGHPVVLDMLTGVSHERVIELMKSSDIVADQFIGGSFGQTAVEAMALGKPVLCYVRDDRQVPERERFPVINVNPDTLYAKLLELTKDPTALPDIGRRSRDYVEAHYSLDALAARLDTLYRAVSPFPLASWPATTKSTRRARYLAASTAFTARWRLRKLVGRAKYNAELAGMRLQQACRRAPGLARCALRYTGCCLRRLASTAQGLRSRVRQMDADAFRHGARGTATRLAAAILQAGNGFKASLGRVAARLRYVGHCCGVALWRAWVSIRLAATRSIRSLLAVVAQASKRLRIVCTPLLIRGLVALSRAMTRWRIALGNPRTLWGITPILTLPLLARADRALGLRSESMVFVTYYISSSFDINLKRVSDWVIREHPTMYAIFTKAILAWALVRYDVFHYFCDRGILLPDPGPIGINERELDLLRRSGKRVFTYTYGADVRTRQRTLALGTLNFCMHCPTPGRLCICDDEKGRRNVATIGRYASAMAAMGDMKAYVSNHVDLHFWPIDVRRLRTESMPRRAGPLRVAHAPNHPHFKGTPYLEQAIDRLQAEGYAIELVRVQGVPNDRVLELFRDADVVAEQFIGGFHGYTALEAMALAKPVLAYIRSPDLLIDADACPIINTTPDTLYDTLKAIVEGRYDLASLGARGRAFVERYYSVEAVAVRLADMYLEYAKFGHLGSHRIRRRAQRLARALEAARPLAGGPNTMVTI
ncbi:MAG: hypothetical protein IT531_15780 [Burkholderiales bacterium]|nr:hypothetical protein [Burkholderiales bacterium]